jgi:hypothetical protein
LRFGTPRDCVAHGDDAIGEAHRDTAALELVMHGRDDAHRLARPQQLGEHDARHHVRMHHVRTLAP